MSKRPILYIIAGSNGSGKTTFAKEFLPNFENCYEFVNADLIAFGLSPFSAQTSNLQAGRLVLTRIRELSKRRLSFGFETTLAGRTYVRLLKKLRGIGYEIRIYFLWVQNVELALQRISDRVKRGGHGVPESDVRRRYWTGLYNLFHLYRPLTDFIAIIDNSTESPELIAIGDSKRYWSSDKKIVEEIQRLAKLRGDKK